MKRTRKLVASMFAATLMAVTAAAPASAQPVGNIGVGNLVNVQINNVLNNNDIDVTVPVSAAVNIAANVCGVSVDVLSIDDDDDDTIGPVSCTNTQRADSVITIDP